MRITYVLARPELGGGTKVVFQHADLLLDRLEQNISRARRQNHFGAMLFELASMGKLSRRRLEKMVEFEGLENYERARDRGRGVLHRLIR